MFSVLRQVTGISLLQKCGSFSCPGFCRVSYMVLNDISSHKSSLLHHINGRPFTWSSWAVAIASSSPVHFCQESLSQFHDLSGLPWWSVILLSTVGVRACVTLPMYMYQNHIIARLENVRNELKDIGPKLNREVAIAAKKYGWDPKISKSMFRKNMHRHYTRLILQENCHPFKTVILALVQVPMWICFSFSLRNLVYMIPTQDTAAYVLAAQLNYLDLKMGGILWFTDLTLPDTVLIPVLLAVVNFTLIEINSLRRIGKVTLLQKISVNSMRLITVMVSLTACFNPTAVTFYWLSSSVFGLGQNILFMMPKVRRTMRIPQTPSESSTPFQDIFRNLKTVLSR